MIVENLTTLNIHKLSKEQYKRELEAGRIDENALYLTEDDESSVSSWNDLTDKPFYEEENLVDIYPLTTVSGFTYEEEFGAPVSVMSYPQLAVGETYIVNWDNIEYTCIGQDVSAFTGLPGTVAIGNCSILIPGLTGNSEPFIIAGRLGEGMAIAFDEKESHKIRISQRGNIVTPLDNKYLDIFQKDEIIFPAKEADYISVNGMHFQLFPDDKCKINIGETYVVNWDGENYSCVAKALRHIGYPNGVYLGGNVPSFGVPANEYPFCIVMTGEDSITAFSVGDPEGENVKHILQITRKVANNYLIKKEHLIQSDWFVADPKSADYIKNKPFGYLPYGTILFSGKAAPQANMSIYFGALDIPFMPYDIVRLGANINGDGYEYKDIEFNADKTMATSSSNGHTFHIFRSYADANLENDGRTVYFAVEAEDELNPEGIDVVIKLDEWVNMHIPEIYLPKISSLPEVNETDEGKVLSVVEGKWQPSNKLANVATIDFVLEKIAEIQEPQVDEEIIFPEQEVHFNFNEEENSWAWSALTNPIGLKEGETYKVILNGKEYKSEPAILETAYVDYNSIQVSVINDEGTEIIQFEDYYSKETGAYSDSRINDYISRSADITNVIEIRKWVDSSQTCSCPEDLVIRIEKSPIFSKSNLELLSPDVSTNVFSTYTIQLTSPIGLEYKKLYKIKIDEEEFISRVEAFPASGGTYLYMGNHALLWGRLGEDTGEKYYITDIYTNGQFYLASICVRDQDNTLESVTRSIEIIPIDEKINDKYLPDNLGSNEARVLFPEQELYFEGWDDDGDGGPDAGSEPMYIQTSPIGLEEGKFYTITWNGVKYEKCICINEYVNSQYALWVMGLSANDTPVFSIMDLYDDDQDELIYSLTSMVDYVNTESAINTVKIEEFKLPSTECNCPKDLIAQNPGKTVFEQNNISLIKGEIIEGLVAYGTAIQQSIISLDKIYQVEINGEIGSTKVEKISIAPGTYFLVAGNPSMIMPEAFADNGTNFGLIEIWSNNKFMDGIFAYLPKDTSEEIIVANIKVQEVIEQINEKYLPEIDLSDYATKQYVTDEIMKSGGGGDGVSSWKYLLDKPFDEGQGYETLIPIQEFSNFVLDTEELGTPVIICNTGLNVGFVVGETYRIHWDGVDYDCVAQDATTVIDVAASGAIALGNGLAFGLAGNNEPFIIAYFYGNILLLPLTDQAPGATHTVGISKSGYIIKKLDNKFLDIFETQDYILPHRGFGGFGQDAEFNLPFPCVYDFNCQYRLEIGSKYIITWDGQDYECTAYDGSEFLSGAIYVGNGGVLGFPGDEVPFLIALMPDFNAVCYGAVTDTEYGNRHTVAIRPVGEFKTKIKQELLGGSVLPEVTVADAGKFLRVSDLGTWVLAEIPIAEEAEF